MNESILLRSICALSLTAAIGAAQDGPRVKLDGYAEYDRDGTLFVEGQRVYVLNDTRFEGVGVTNLQSIPLGYEVKVEGHRQPSGMVRATKIEAKPNGSAMYESEVVRETDKLEKMWVDAGEMFFEDGRRRVTVGAILTSGSQVERVRLIMLKLLPPYVHPDDVRVHVVDTDQWNASAMGNGSVWVYTGLLNDMTDDEVAIILGHELAHYTHEHSRKGMKSGTWGQLAGVAGAIGASASESSVVGLGASLGISAWQSGYSREMEDQSDRVGLRYAYEAGFDVSRGPELWKKFRKKYGEEDTLSNFLYGSHSRPTDRIRNIYRELRLNYKDSLE